MLRALSCLDLAVLASCAGPATLAQTHSRERPVDAVIVPGCPTEADGRLSRCQRRRVVWAAHVWEAGLAREVIVSGAATYDRHVEAEALAAGLAALGVPPARVFLETHARHTDENVYYAMQVGERLGAVTFAVASDGGQAPGACSFLASWGRSCVVAPLDEAVVERRLVSASPALDAVRVAPVPDPGWLPVAEAEAAREAGGGAHRPSSLWLYAVRAPLGRLFGKPWVPVPSPDTTPVSYESYLTARAAPPAAPDGRGERGGPRG